MDMLLFGLVLGILLAGFVVAVAAVARGGSVAGVARGLEMAARSNRDPALKAKVDAVLAGGSVASTPTAPPKPTGEPLRLLALLQSEARLVDFLLEDVSGASDSQLGAAVRDIHRKAAAALRDHLTVGPVLAGGEGERVTVPAGFDPSAVRVVGNVTGAPPFTGELQHAGWRVTEIKLPAVASGADGFVLQPAEVQV